MKRHFIKDIIIALLPLALFLGFSYLSQTLQYEAAASFNKKPLLFFNLFAPILVGAILCAVLYYAWKNRASTVFISLYCGAFFMNIFFALCNANIIRAFGGLILGRVTLFGSAVELAGVIDGAYIVMFWVSLVCFIKSKKKKNCPVKVDTGTIE